MIDLKEMPIEEYSRQLLPESKSTQIGNPAWKNCKYAMLWPCCSLFSFKALLLSFKALLFSFKVLLYILDTCVIFLGLFLRALYHSAFIFCQGALS
jgi:hypothetical protein